GWGTARARRNRPPRVTERPRGGRRCRGRGGRGGLAPPSSAPPPRTSGRAERGRQLPAADESPSLTWAGAPVGAGVPSCAPAFSAGGAGPSWAPAATARGGLEPADQTSEVSEDFGSLTGLV